MKYIFIHLTFIGLVNPTIAMGQDKNIKHTANDTKPLVTPSKKELVIDSFQENLPEKILINKFKAIARHGKIFSPYNQTTKRDY